MKLQAAAEVQAAALQAADPVEFGGGALAQHSDALHSRAAATTETVTNEARHPTSPPLPPPALLSPGRVVTEQAPSAERVLAAKESVGAMDAAQSSGQRQVAVLEGKLQASSASLQALDKAKEKVERLAKGAVRVMRGLLLGLVKGNTVYVPGAIMLLGALLCLFGWLLPSTNPTEAAVMYSVGGPIMAVGLVGYCAAYCVFATLNAMVGVQMKALERELSRRLVEMLPTDPALLAQLR